jgi:hypothetical protein
MKTRLKAKKEENNPFSSPLKGCPRNEYGITKSEMLKDLPSVPLLMDSGNNKLYEFPQVDSLMIAVSYAAIAKNIY